MQTQQMLFCLFNQMILNERALAFEYLRMYSVFVVHKLCNVEDS